MPVEDGNGYEKLIRLTEQYPDKVDSYIMSRLTGLIAIVPDINAVALPMLMEVKADSEISWNEHAQVLSTIGSIISIIATPEQIATLIQMEEVIGLDLSR